MNDVNEQMNESASSDNGSTSQVPTLVVVSKVKSYIREKSQMNTSSCFIEAITRKVAEEAAQAIERAKSAGRKTVMGKDVL